MPSDRTQISARITDKQEAAIKAALLVSDDTLAEAIREGMRLYCSKHKIKWPDDMPERGKYER